MSFVEMSLLGILMLPLIVAQLIESGMSILGNAALTKGKDWLEKETGVDLTTKPTLSNEDMIKLRKFEMDHEEELIKLKQEDNKLEVAVEKMYLEDTANARGMQTAALGQSDVFSKRFLYYFSIAWSLFAGLYIFFITFAEIPESNVRFADTILGFLLGSVIAVMFQFFYGSSRSSHQKDETIKSLTKEANDTRN